MKARDNPFSSERQESLAYRFPPGLGFPQLIAKLAEQQNVGAIVGRRGSGKTRLLEELAPHLRAAGFEPHLFRLSSESSMREKERLSAELRKIIKPG